MSMEPEEAAEKVKEAEAEVKAKEDALAEQKANQKKAEDAAAEAKAKAEANPTAENIQNAANATKDAAEESKKTAEAAKEKNEAVAKANDARLDEVGAIVAAGNEKLHHAKANPAGVQLKTDLNFDQFTPANYLRILSNNLSIRVTGGEKKYVLGAAIGIIGGAKNEVVMSMKSSFIFPLEGKTVTGANKNNFAGLKMDTIGGAKIDKVYGEKREQHIGPKVYNGPKTSTKAPIREFLVGAGKCLATKVRNIIKKNQATTGKKTISGSKMLKDVKSLRETVTDWQLTADSEKNSIDTFDLTTGKLDVKSSDTFRYEASGTTTMDGGGAKVVLGGDAELSKGGSIKCDGSGVSVNGKTLVN
jgi:hypothetical protein